VLHDEAGDLDTVLVLLVSVELQFWCDRGHAHRYSPLKMPKGTGPVWSLPLPG
jgi:hypothetical protein